MIKSILILYFFIIAQNIYSQILFTESFNVILDTTKFIQGTITPDFEFQTQKENLLEFENLADMSIRIGEDAITFANKIELTRFGNEIILSGGYLYGEYRIFEDKVFIPEFYAQMHWAEARGLERKYAGGAYGRFRIFRQNNIGIFAGTGPFYEYENWNYDGVPVSELPGSTENIVQKNIKLASYLSYKHILFKKINLDLSIYHQSRFDDIFDTPRLASSSKIGYSLSDNFELVFMYQNIYDYKPIVPIDKWFHKYILSIAVTF